MSDVLLVIFGMIGVTMASCFLIWLVYFIRAVVDAYRALGDLENER